MWSGDVTMVVDLIGVTFAFRNQCLDFLWFDMGKLDLELVLMLSLASSFNRILQKPGENQQKPRENLRKPKENLTQRFAKPFRQPQYNIYSAHRILQKGHANHPVSKSFPGSLHELG